MVQCDRCEKDASFGYEYFYQNDLVVMDLFCEECHPSSVMAMLSENDNRNKWKKLTDEEFLIFEIMES